MFFKKMFVYLCAVIIPSQSQSILPQQFDFNTFKYLLNSAAYDGLCDKDLHHNFVAPIYAAKTLPEQVEARMRLNNHLGKYPDMREKSCYGIIQRGRDRQTLLDEIYMSCQPCPDRNNLIDNGTYCCRCLQEEPLVFERAIAGANPCKMKESLLGDPCDFEQMQSLNNKAYFPLRHALRRAHWIKDYVVALDKMAVALSEFLVLMRNHRLVCYSEWNNLECKENNRCGCWDQPPYLRYVPAHDGIRCVGQNGSICHIQYVVTGMGVFEKLANCKNSECEDAVKGLRCDPLDRSCKFTSELALGGQARPEVLLWNIRACGGYWSRHSAIASATRALFEMTTIAHCSVALLFLAVHLSPGK